MNLVSPFQLFVGNSDQTSWATNGFNFPLVAISVRLIAVKWETRPGLRLDFIGCLGKILDKQNSFLSFLGLEVTLINSLYLGLDEECVQSAKKNDEN